MESVEQLVPYVATASVQTLDGTVVQLRELWRTGVTINIFLRQFGCLFCHELVQNVLDSLPALLEHGVQAVIVGNGSVEQARRFYEAKRLPRAGVSVVTDSARETYKAAEFERGFVKTFLNAGSRHAFARARAAGHKITGWFGDLTQLGGVLVVLSPARPLFFFKSRHAGDHPDLVDMRAAIEPHLLLSASAAVRPT